MFGVPRCGTSIVLFACAAFVACDLPPRDGFAGGGTTTPDMPPVDAGVATGLVTVCFAESDEAFANPERGFHLTHEEGTSPAFIRAAGRSLTRLYVRLDDFRTTSLSTAKLEALDADLAAIREAGLKVVLRFTYNFPSTWPNDEPDASLSRALGHIAQLAPVLRQNVDVIDTMQAGFIGNWGEWHSSTHGLDVDVAAQKQIVDALLAALPPERALQLRYPNSITDLYGAPLTEAEAFGPSAKARLGLHNDCFLASDDDEGTFGRTGTGVGASPEDGKSFIASIGLFAPIGGETCAVFPPRSSCATAMEELESMHFSYLNLEFHAGVIESWKSGGCFDEIDRRLGHRLVLDAVTHSERASPGGPLTFEATVRNVGYAALHNARPMLLVLEGNGVRRELPLGFDPRRFTPGRQTVVSTTVTIPPDVPAGTYTLSLWLPDAAESLRARPEYAVRFANTGVWDAALGMNQLGSQVTVGP